LQLAGSDPEGAALTYSGSGLPPGLSVNASSGLISGTPTTAGTYTVTATVRDPAALSVSRTFTWTVTTTSGSTTTVTLSPIDTTLTVENAGGNYVTGQRLETHTYPSYRAGAAALLRFDLSSIPANATIQSATLQLYLIRADSASDPSYGVSLHQVLNVNPDLARATALTYNGTTPWTPASYSGPPLAQADISPARAVTQVDQAEGMKTWDASALVSAWRASPAANYGVLVNADVSKVAGRYRNFASMEATVAAQRPSLRVTYSLPSGDTTAPAVALTAPSQGTTVSGASVLISATASDAVSTLRTSAPKIQRRRTRWR
jgi:hypothetical protein